MYNCPCVWRPTRVCVLHYTITLYSAVLCRTEGDGSGVGGGL